MTYVVANEIAGLDKHVVQRRGDGSGSHTTRVARRDGNIDGVDVWRAHQKDSQCVSNPVTGILGDSLEGDQ